MRTTWLLPAVLLSLTAQAGGEAGSEHLQTYSNVRFQYAVSYPARRFQGLGEADNGDGQKFVSRHPQATLTVFGRFRMPDETLSARERQEQAAEGVTYHVLRSGWFVISGVHHGEVFYEKVILHRDKFLTLELTYPVARRGWGDRLVGLITRSFHPLD